MIKYRILPEQRLIAICNWGVTPVDEILKFSQKLRSDPDFSRNYDVIIDNTDLHSNYSKDEIEILAEPRIDTGPRNHKIAIVAKEDWIFGISRMHEMMSEEKVTYNIHVFYETNSAMKWLGMEELDIQSTFEEIRRRVD